MDAALVVPILALMGVIGAAIITQRSAKTTGEVWRDLNGELRVDRDYWRQRAIEAEKRAEAAEKLLKDADDEHETGSN